MPSRAYPAWLEGNGNVCYAGYIKSAIQSTEDFKLHTIRDEFDLEFSFNQIRFVLACLIQEIEL